MDEFEAQQELAKLSLAIQEGRRELDGLRSLKEEFIEERSKEVNAAVYATLESCKSVLNEAKEAANAVVAMRIQAEECLNQAKDLKKAAKDTKEAKEEEIKDLLKTLEEDRESLKDQETVIIAERIRQTESLEGIKTLLAVIEKEKQSLRNERHKLAIANQVCQKQQETKTE